MTITTPTKRSLPGLAVSLALLSLSLVPLATYAVPLPAVTYTEILDDIDDRGLLGINGILLDVERDLERTRILGDGTVLQESDDATIASQNAVSANFGISTVDPITYSHMFIDVPAVAEFVMASLTLEVFSVSGTPTNFLELSFGIGPIPNDPVFVDGLFVGFLQPGGPFIETTTTFSDDNEAVVSFLPLTIN